MIKNKININHMLEKNYKLICLINKIKKAEINFKNKIKIINRSNNSNNYKAHPVYKNKIAYKKSYNF